MPMRSATPTRMATGTDSSAASRPRGTGGRPTLSASATIGGPKTATTEATATGIVIATAIAAGSRQATATATTAGACGRRNPTAAPPTAPGMSYAGTGTTAASRPAHLTADT